MTVRGRVRIGEKPIEGTIVLGGLKGAIRITLPTNAEGEFSGWLPQSFTDDELPVLVECSRPRLRRQARVPISRPEPQEVYVDVALPATQLGVTVVDEVGQPWRGRTIVTAQQLTAEAELVQNVVTDPDPSSGSFELEGLSPGQYVISAVAGGDFASDHVPVTIQEDQHASVKLMLRQRRSINGMVVSSEGRPIAGATVIAMPFPALIAFSSQTTTDGEGRFGAEMPPGTEEILLRVLAPGFAYRIFRTRYPDDGSLTITVGRASGTIVFTHDAPLAQADDGPYLFHEGAFDHLTGLRSWAAMHGQGTDPAQTVIPEMAPGHYRLCRVSLWEFQAFTLGHPSNVICKEGTLDPGGTLRIVVPEGRTKGRAPGVSQSR
jgi:hypothetical protein